MVSHAINLYLFPQNGFHFGRSQWFPLSEFTVATSAIFDSIAPGLPGQHRLGSGREHFSVTEQQDFDTCIQFICRRLKRRLVFMGCDNFSRTSVRTGADGQAHPSPLKRRTRHRLSRTSQCRHEQPAHQYIYIHCRHNQNRLYVCKQSQ